MKQKIFLHGFILSVLLHIALVVLLFCSISTADKVTLALDSSTEINKSKAIKENLTKKYVKPIKTVNAVAISSEQLASEVAKVRSEYAIRKANEEKEIQKLKKKQADVEKSRATEEKKLRSLREKLKAQEKEQGKIASNLAKDKKELDWLNKEKIRLDNERKKLLNQAKAADESRKKALEEKLAIERENKQNLARKQKLIANEVSKYAILIKEKVILNWVNPLDGLDNLSTVMNIRTNNIGEVVAVNVAKSSGNESFDRAAELAVLKSSPLPMPYDDEISNHFKLFSFTFKPES